MTIQELPIEQLLEKCPDMDYTKDYKLGHGGCVDPVQACEKIEAFRKFTKDQTICVSFDSKQLVDWIKGHSNRIDEVFIFFTLDPDNKFNVVLWPFKEGKPTISDDSQTNISDAAMAASPYNIGGRRP